jgi:hypothetical protein
MQLLDQQPETATDAAPAEQGMEQEQARTPEHRQHIDAGLAEAANAFYQ